MEKNKLTKRVKDTENDVKNMAISESDSEGTIINKQKQRNYNRSKKHLIIIK